MENYKTIKEIADELNISKQALQKRINNLPDNLKPTKIGGKFLINADLQRYFYGIFENQQPKDNLVVDFNNHLLVVVDELKADKEILVNRIEVKEKEMERMQQLLDQQQQLTLQSNKQIEKLQLQLELKKDDQKLNENNELEELKESLAEERKAQENYKLKEQLAKVALDSETKKGFWRRMF